MAFDELLVHTANTFRRSGDRDEFNQPVDTQRGDAYLVSEPCRANVKSGGEQFGERSIDVIVDKGVVFFGPDADIREDDAMEVYAADGDTLIVGLQANITQVRPVTDGTGLVHHIEVDIQTVRGPIT